MAIDIYMAEKLCSKSKIYSVEMLEGGEDGSRKKNRLLTEELSAFAKRYFVTHRYVENVHLPKVKALFKNSLCYTDGSIKFFLRLEDRVDFLASKREYYFWQNRKNEAIKKWESIDCLPQPLGK